MADDSNKKYSGKTAHPLAKLKKRADVTVKELLAKLAIAEANIMTAIVRCQNPAYAKNQRDLYNKIRESYFKLCRQIDLALKSDVASAATDAYHQLEDELGSDGLVRWDEERAKRYWQYVAPEQSQSLAAVYTDKMAESAITSLRQALIETERQASIEGWTMNEKQKALQAKWASLASRADFQFVDKAGKGWEHARYLQMLTRTTAQRVYNDSYLDRVAENGIKLVRVTALGAPECEVCRAWQGVICSIDGTARGLPSIEAAKSAGVFHPNCVCIHEAVIEEVDKTELAIQRKHPFTKDISDLDAYEARKFAIDRERYERKGLSAEEARIAVNRDNLELAIRNGLIRSDAREIVDGLTDTQVAALCPDGKTPRFEPLKKGDTAKIVRGSRGGVVHIARNATVEDLVNVTGVKDAKLPEPAKVEVPKWTPQTDLEKKTDALMRSIGAEHTDKPLGIEGVNPNYSTNDFHYTNNCGRCCDAFEVRARGYEVIAKGTSGNRRLTSNGDWMQYGNALGGGGWCEMYAGNNLGILFGNSKRKIEREMAKWGNGARAKVFVQWKGGGGHFFVAEQINGSTVFKCPQSGKTYDDTVWNMVKNSRFNAFLRTDNLELNGKIFECIEKP